MDCWSRGACGGGRLEAGAPHIELRPGVGTIGSSVKIAFKPCSIEDICSSEDDESSRCAFTGCDMPFGNDSVRDGWLDDELMPLEVC
mmetsp:Transcript_8734/g.16656  ORF Transcript_8734/g.16656 Transcript_8734/m.16656 type:complete len:87 (-) Transcript_8734:686-946(-)